jgi:hypothetical protein
MDDDTLIYRFHDGERWKAVDPFWVDRELAVALEGEPLPAVVEAARRDDAPGLGALRKLAAAVCKAFGLEALKEDGSGQTARTAFRVFREYVAWRDQLKKNAAATPSTSPPTAPPPSDGPLLRQSVLASG